MISLQRYMRFLFVLLCCALSPSAGSEPAKVTADERLASVRSITATDPVERAEKLWTLLGEELVHPCTAVSSSIPMDSGYVQEVIIGSCCYMTADEETCLAVRDWADDKLRALPNSDQPQRDILKIIKGCTGDASVLDDLTRILLMNPQGAYRMEAARALFRINDRRAIPALKKALESDTYACFRPGACHERLTSEQMVYSPVRLAAAEALRRFGETVPKDAELVDRKYLVPKFTPLLYTEKTPWDAVQVLAAVGGSEAEQALDEYISKYEKDPARATFVEWVRDLNEQAKKWRSDTQENQQPGFE